jgi:hypothetical protein
VWFAAALVFGPIHWTAWAALVLNLVIFVLCFFIVERYGHVRMPPSIEAQRISSADDCTIVWTEAEAIPLPCCR